MPRYRRRLRKDSRSSGPYGSGIDLVGRVAGGLAVGAAFLAVYGTVKLSLWLFRLVFPS